MCRILWTAELGEYAENAVLSNAQRSRRRSPSTILDRTILGETKAGQATSRLGERTRNFSYGS